VPSLEFQRQVTHSTGTGTSDRSSRAATTSQYRCRHRGCDYIPTGGNHAQLVRIHEARQHNPSIRCDEDGCDQEISNGRKDNLAKHKNTNNCAGFRRKKAAEVARQHAEELAPEADGSGELELEELAEQQHCLTPVGLDEAFELPGTTSPVASDYDVTGFEIVYFDEAYDMIVANCENEEDIGGPVFFE